MISRKRLGVLRNEDEDVIDEDEDNGEVRSKKAMNGNGGKGIESKASKE